MTQPSNPGDPDIVGLVRSLRELMTNATPGPWEAMQPDEVDVFVPIVAVNLSEDGRPLHTPTRGLVGDASIYPTEIDAEDYTRAEANAALIAHAISALPALLDALECQHLLDNPS